MSLPRISGKALWKIIEDVGVNPHWVTGFSYQVKDRIMKIEMIAVVDNSPVLNEAKDGIETTMVDIPVCSCTSHCAEVKTNE